MPYLSNYSEFDGLHWETGSIRNYFAYRGVTAPHTNEPYSEALLMGISGGAVMGYFSFAYEGYDPHVALLTRNTFDPWDTLLQRIGVTQTVLQTGSQKKGLFNLVDTLESGLPAIVWADMFSLPYNALPRDDGMWGMMPILVFDYDESADVVSIADRARVPLQVTPAELEAARSRVKKTKYRVITLDPPTPEKLKSAVQLGIWDCIKLYTEKPPKGSAVNFGFKAYQRWAELLTKPTMRLSWAEVFPQGIEMYAGLTTTLDGIAVFGKDGGAERYVFADFLVEAGIILEKSALAQVADQFRASSIAWDRLGEALLPDDFPILREAREGILERHQIFLNKGSGGLQKIQAINARLAEIREQMETDFPLSDAEVNALRESISQHILEISAIEEQAVADLRAAVE